MFMTSVLRMISFSLSTFNFFVAFCFFPSFLRDFAHLSSFGLFGDLRGRLKTCGSGCLGERKIRRNPKKNGDDIPSSFPFVRRTSSHEHTLTHTRSTRDDVFFLVFFFCSRDDEFHDDDKNDSVRVDEASQSSRSKVGEKHNGGTFVEEE
jgi:hypothetical protein